jgi:hypothetical protein
MGLFSVENIDMVFLIVSCIRQFPVELQRGQAPLPREFISTIMFIIIANFRQFCYTHKNKMDIKEFVRNFIDGILSLSDKLLDRIPENKRRIVIYSLGGLVFLFMILTIIALVGSGKKSANTQAIVASTGIPAEELFYPAEPDFLPSLLLERWPGEPWTEEEIRGFWTDPGPGFEERWRATAEAVIDRLMEGVH